MKQSIYIILFVLLLGGIAFGVSKIPEKPGEYDEFAQCIADSGAKFWGAFWCPHCNNQKKDFGRSAKLLPYIECSTPDGRGQKQECTDAGVEGYPTWDFPNGERMTGELSFETLSENTSCQLPEVN